MLGLLVIDVFKFEGPPNKFLGVMKLKVLRAGFVTFD